MLFEADLLMRLLHSNSCGADDKFLLLISAKAICITKAQCKSRAQGICLKRLFTCSLSVCENIFIATQTPDRLILMFCELLFQSNACYLCSLFTHKSRRAAKRIQMEDFLAVAFCFAKQFFIQVNYVVFSLMLSLFFTLVEHFSRETFNSIWHRGPKNDFKSATLNPPNRAKKLFASEIIFAFYWFVIAN